MTDLEEFFDLIYDGEEGYAYTATKSGEDFNQEFFEWPKQKDALVEHVLEESKDKDVYYGPALYERPVARKHSVRGARVFWCEFDGVLPKDLQGIPRPHLRVRSSTDGHEHWYWRSDKLVSPTDLENVNRRITYTLGADTSGWDSTQILRPPETLNFKRDSTGIAVTLVGQRNSFTSLNHLDNILPGTPEPIEIPANTELPEVSGVIASYTFSKELFKLFREGPEGEDRSRGLMNLGYELVELGMKDDEVLALLVHADNRWGKFKERPDRLIRLAEIVSVGRQKYPNAINSEDSFGLQPFGFDALLKHDVQIEWVWEGLLEKSGTLLISGPPAIGKTQFALNMALNFCLGQDFLGFVVPRTYRVGFFSLEMGHAELKVFYGELRKSFDDEETLILDKQFLTFPVGEPLYLTNESVQQLVEDLVEEYELDGIIFDSLGSTTPDSLTNDVDARKIMDWNDRFRNRRGVFTTYIHHNRKASGDNKRPNKLADVYGSVYFQARPTSVFCLWENRADRAGNSIEFIPLKTRLVQKPAPFIIQRDFTLRYTRQDKPIEIEGPRIDLEPEENKQQNSIFDFGGAEGEQS